MKRRDFIKAAGVVAASTLMPPEKVFTQQRPETVQIDSWWHYCNWLNMNSSNIASTFPLKGDYESENPSIIAQHMSEMKRLNMSPLVSWWGDKNHYAGDAFWDVFMNVPTDVKAGLLYEATGRIKGDGQTPYQGFDFDDAENRERFVRDIDYVNKRYFTKFPDRMLKVDGKPVVFIWISHAFYGRFQDAIRDARNVADAYFIGSNFNLGGGIDPAWEPHISAFDAISAYSVYDDPAIRQSGGPNEKYVNKYLQAINKWELYLANHTDKKTKLIPPISFSFDNTHGTTPNKNEPYFMNANQATYFSEKVRDAIAQGYNNKVILPHIVGVSWNERYEGTSMEESGHLSATHGRSLGEGGHPYGEPPYAEYARIFDGVMSKPFEVDIPERGHRSQGYVRSDEDTLERRHVPIRYNRTLPNFGRLSR